MIIHYTYLLALVAAYAGMLYADWRWGLVWWADWRWALGVQLIGVMIFVIWDISAIAQGIFYPGASIFMTGLKIGPYLPIEEVGFLVFFVYQPLVYWELLKRWRNI